MSLALPQVTSGSTGAAGEGKSWSDELARSPLPNTEQFPLPPSAVLPRRVSGERLLGEDVAGRVLRPWIGLRLRPVGRLTRLPLELDPDALGLVG